MFNVDRGFLYVVDMYIMLIDYKHYYYTLIFVHKACAPVYKTLNYGNELYWQEKYVYRHEYMLQYKWFNMCWKYN